MDTRLGSAGAGLAHASLAYSIELTRTSRAVLSYSGDDGHQCFVPDLQGNVSAGYIKSY